MLVEFNIFANIHKSFMFLLIFGVTVVCQIMIVELFGRFANTRPLTWYQWLVSVIVGVMCIPFSLLVRLITRLVLVVIRRRKHEVDEEYAPVDE
jgi:Ca2+-transporting ATPase